MSGLVCYLIFFAKWFISKGSPKINVTGKTKLSPRNWLPALDFSLAIGQRSVVTAETVVSGVWSDLKSAGV